MKILIKALLVLTLIFIISCRPKNYEIHSTITDSGGDGKITFSDGTYLQGNFKGNNCYDCTLFIAVDNRPYFGNFSKVNNSWGFIEGNKYSTIHNIESTYAYVVDFIYRVSSQSKMAQPIKVTYKGDVYEIYANFIEDVPDIISSSRPIGLTYDEALKECKTLGFDDASNELLDCVVELSQ